MRNTATIAKGLGAPVAKETKAVDSEGRIIIPPILISDDTEHIRNCGPKVGNQLRRLAMEQYWGERVVVEHQTEELAILRCTDTVAVVRPTAVVDDVGMQKLLAEGHFSYPHETER